MAKKLRYKKPKKINSKWGSELVVEGMFGCGKSVKFLVERVRWHGMVHCRLLFCDEDLTETVWIPLKSIKGIYKFTREGK